MRFEGEDGRISEMDIVLERISDDSYRIGFTNRNGELNSGTLLTTTEEKAREIFEASVAKEGASLVEIGDFVYAEAKKLAEESPQ